LLAAVQQLYSMQTSLVAELVRQGQREGDFDSSLDARDAATLFVGFIQSATSRRRLEASAEPLELEGRRLFELWLRGVRAHGPPRVSVRSLEPGAPRSDGLVVLDVRPLLSQGIDPLENVLSAVEAVGPGGVVKLSVPFRPAPLIALLSARGHRLRDEQCGPRLWTLEIIVGGRPLPEDLRSLEAPEPLERVLEACGGLAEGSVYLARLPRNPTLLVPHLRQRGLGFQVHEEADGTAFLRVYRPQ
jgi:uncharacterized protein (DUF2249 family)